MHDSEPLVLHQDNHLIAVYKPAGWLSQGDRTGDPSLVDWVKAWLARTYHKPGQVFLGLLHRLDRPVCGVMVFARTSKAASRMSRLFRERQVEKIYWAALQGQIEPPAGRLVHHIAPPLLEAGPVRVYERATDGAKEAGLQYRTLWSEPRGCVVEVQLETGRKHQIRAQFAHVGHPIHGDRRYGATRAFAGAGIGLAAVQLSFEHPVTKQRVTIALPEHLCPVALRRNTVD